jgi:hypothetical protein
MLTTEDPAVAADTERFAVEVAARAKARGGVLDDAVRRELVTTIAERDAAEVMSSLEPTVAQRYEAVDVTLLGRVGDDLTAAYLVDRHNARKVERAEAVSVG